MELLTGFGLATAAGLNAYIPLLALGLLSRFTDLVTLPAGWSWLENGWVMAIVAVLLVVEIIADKIPALDSVNDTVQTFIRPTAGGTSSVRVQRPRHLRSPIPALSRSRDSGSRWRSVSSPRSWCR